MFGGSNPTTTSGTLTRLLKSGVTQEEELEDGSCHTVNRAPTLQEVMLDFDFLAEVKLQNEALDEYLTLAKAEEMCELITKEPGFECSAERCFLLPKLACESLLVQDSCLVKFMFGPDYKLLDKLFEFYV